MPDAPGLELLLAAINQEHAGAVLDTSFDREQAALIVDPVKVVEVLSGLEPGDVVVTTPPPELQDMGRVTATVAEAAAAPTAGEGACPAVTPAEAAKEARP